MPDADLPRFPRPPRRVSDPAFDLRLEALKKERNAAAERLDLAPGVLCPNGTLEAIARAEPENLGALGGVAGVRRWQLEVIGAELLTAMHAAQPVASREAGMNGGAGEGTGTVSAEIARKALRAVKDPELGLNIIDIGLVYDVAVTDDGVAHVKMTLTSPGCPAGAEIMDDVETTLDDLDGITDCRSRIGLGAVLDAGQDGSASAGVPRTLRAEQQPVRSKKVGRTAGTNLLSSPPSYFSLVAVTCHATFRPRREPHRPPSRGLPSVAGTIAVGLLGAKLRLVRNTTKRSWPGSIQISVPVQPVCP